MRTIGRQRLPLRVILHREDDRLVVEPVKRKRTLAEILPQLEPIAEEFPEIPDPPVRSEDILPMEEPADGHYGAIRTELERIGRPIGHNDLLIAAHARALGATLVTRNVDEFARVPNLIIESWVDES